MSPRGGKRAGAGRPKTRETPPVLLCLRIDEGLRDAFWLKAGNLSGPAFLAKLLKYKP